MCCCKAKSNKIKSVIIEDSPRSAGLSIFAKTIDKNIFIHKRSQTTIQPIRKGMKHLTENFKRNNKSHPLCDYVYPRSL